MKSGVPTPRAKGIAAQSDNSNTKRRWVGLRKLCPPHIIELALERLMRHPVNAAMSDKATLTGKLREAWKSPCQGRWLQPRAARGRLVEIEPATVAGCDLDSATTYQDLADGWPTPKHRKLRILENKLSTDRVTYGYPFDSQLNQLIGL